MKHITRMRGAEGVKWGIWNSVKKEFQFHICEDTPLLAEARLAQIIGDDARKWRFEAKPLPKEMERPSYNKLVSSLAHAEEQLDTVMLKTAKQQEIIDRLSKEFRQSLVKNGTVPEIAEKFVDRLVRI